MADDIAKNYQDQISQMRAERNARESRVEAENIANVWKATAELRDDAAVEGDLSTFEDYDRECEALEKEWAALPANQQPQSGAWTEAKARWVQQRWDLKWDEQRKQVATAAHEYVTKQLGISEDSPEYFKSMEHYLEPPGYEKPATPDDVAASCGIDADTYNRGVRELQRRKANGQYRDK